MSCCRTNWRYVSVRAGLACLSACLRAYVHRCCGWFHVLVCLFVCLLFCCCCWCLRNILCTHFAHKLTGAHVYFADIRGQAAFDVRAADVGGALSRPSTAPPVQYQNSKKTKKKNNKKTTKTPTYTHQHTRSDIYTYRAYQAEH